MKLLRCREAGWIDGLVEGSGDDRDSDWPLEADAQRCFALRSTWTGPNASTAAMPASLESNLLSQVTSRQWPSVYWARTSELLLVAGPQRAVAGSAVRCLRTSGRLSRSRRAGLNPGEQHFVFAAADVEAVCRPRAGPGRSACGAAGFLGSMRYRSAARANSRVQIQIILFRRIAAERQAKAVLPAALAVASTLIAAEPREQRHHIVDKRRRLNGRIAWRAA